ncbi:MAG TPA: hypothetical protein VH374_17925 [Polyangia bacterium]|jgi:hypothetical protein|nr:hypothetical protein [Polyangia bacterium]
MFHPADAGGTGGSNGSGSGGMTTTGSGGAAATGTGGMATAGTGGSTTPDGGNDTSGGTGGMMGTGGAAPTAICTQQGDCTAVLKMDGAYNINPPESRQMSDGLEGPTGNDGVPGVVCVPTDDSKLDTSTPFKQWHWQLMGPGITMGTNYMVTIHITGVLECKTYNGGCTRPADQGRDGTYDMWCPNGVDPPDHWNTEMLSVTADKSSTAAGIGQKNGAMPAMGSWWDLNECPQAVIESHQTWKADYEKTITVPGGSWINYLEFDTNCREIVNCGTSVDAAQVCTSQFSITPPATSVPAPPASITTQPAASGGGAYGQWVFFDIKSIVPM